MRIGFAKEDITPPVGVELGGYAGYRPNAGVHDPLWCRAVVLEQNNILYSLLVLDLMCADDIFCRQLASVLEPLGLMKNHIVISAIHSHSAPCGVVPGEGLMAGVCLPGYPKDDSYLPYLDRVMQAAYRSCEKAVASLESFSVRCASCPAPLVGSERHTGADPKVMLMAIECRTDSGKSVILYHFPCHPTVMGPANLEVTADFTANIEGLLDSDMAVFLNGAAGDISTRYTRKGQTFDECARLGTMAAQAVQNALLDIPYQTPGQLRGISGSFSIKVRSVEPVEEAAQRLNDMIARVEQAESEGADGGTIRMLKSYAEGAGINLQFARSIGNLREISFPITVFRFAGEKFVTIPGELFSTLLPEDGSHVIGYANGYHLYIADKAAYDGGCYEALASLFARGEGERLMEYVELLLRQLDE